jgi:outer membrane protein TolC
VSVNVNLGLTQTGQNIPLAYNNLLRNQSLAIGFIIPLIDWGANRASIKKAEADLSLQAYSIEQELLLIEQEILYHVTRWRQQQEQMEFARQSMQLSQQRYQIAKEKYTVGSLSFTDFNTAQMEKDAGIIDYIQNVYDYWSLYFLLRRLTLYDFEHQKNIAVTVRQAG